MSSAHYIDYRFPTSKHKWLRGGTSRWCGSAIHQSQYAAFWYPIRLYWLRGTVKQQTEKHQNSNEMVLVILKHHFSLNVMQAMVHWWSHKRWWKFQIWWIQYQLTLSHREEICFVGQFPVKIMTQKRSSSSVVWMSSLVSLCSWITC